MIVRDLEKDFGIGVAGETRFKNFVESLGYECEFNSDKNILSHYDITIKGIGTVEVKNDIFSAKTGNVAIEYWNSKLNKPSGISVTKSDIWCHIIRGNLFVVKTQDLKNFTETVTPKRIIERAGDDNASLKLYSINRIMEIFIPIERIGEIICGFSKIK